MVVTGINFASHAEAPMIAAIPNQTRRRQYVDSCCTAPINFQSRWQK
jgi:hypothetical protein